MGLMEQIKQTEQEIQAQFAPGATPNTAPVGRLKARLAKYKTEMVDGSRITGMGGIKESDFEVSKSGDARVAMIGFPSVGKSSLLTKLTSNESEVGAQEFTTLTAIPGKLEYKGAALRLMVGSLRGRFRVDEKDIDTGRGAVLRALEPCVSHVVGVEDKATGSRGGLGAARRACEFTGLRRIFFSFF